MVKHKTTSKNRKKKYTADRKSSVKSQPISERTPEYMIQISDPKMLRKDILESLREVIIFMQGYEKFRKIQEEKVILFSALKICVRELNSLIEHKLRSYLPRGKLKSTVEAKRPTEAEEQEEVEAAPIRNRSDKIEEVKEEPRPKRDLAEFESQLDDIERELKKIS